MTEIHPTAIVDPTAFLADQVEIGPYAVIGAESCLEQGVKVFAHGVVGPYTHVGAGTRIHSYAVVGGASQDLKSPPEAKSFLKIGKNNIIREHCTLNRATDVGAETLVGDDNLFMAYCHIAHDCRVGNGVVLANGATLGGHVVLGDKVVIGAMSGIHQFVEIGELSMIGAMSRVCQNTPPFMMVVGSPPKIYGLNTVGLRRAGYSSEERKRLKQAFNTLYRGRWPLTEALNYLDALQEDEAVFKLAQFIRLSQRGTLGYSKP